MDHNAMGMDPCDNQNDAIFNITTDKRTHVDARTGLFEAHVPLPSVTGNVGYGPVVDMSLYYSPVVNNHAALGDGWSFAFTTWYEKNSDLTLHTGEALRVEKGKDLFTPAVMVTWSDGCNTLTVERKDGRVETLRKQGDSCIWVPVKLTTDGYRYLNFTWATQPQDVGGKTHHQIRLVTIDDPERRLLAVSYGPDIQAPATIVLIFWPDTDETLRFTLNLEDYALRSVTAPEGTTTTLDYLEHATCGWLLASVTTFEGLSETVVYEDNGLKFKDKPKLSALPAVAVHTVTPRAGGAAVTERYSYVWETDPACQDIPIPGSHEGTSRNVAALAPSYQTQMRNGDRLVVYRYRADHEMWMESTIVGDHRKTKIFGSRNLSDDACRDNVLGKLVLTYYDEVAREFGYSLISNEGLAIHLDRTTLATYTHNSPHANATPSEAFGDSYLIAEHIHAIPDQKKIDSSDLLRILSDSTGDRSKALESLGLLEDDLISLALPYDVRPTGKSHRRLSNMGAPVVDKAYTYTKINGFHRKKIRCLSQLFGYGGALGQALDYFEDDDFKKGRHRCITQGNIKNLAKGEIEAFEEACSIRLDFDYSLDERRTALTTTTIETRDGLSRRSSETRSVLSGRLIGQIDADDNETSYTYDQYGRLCTHTTAAQSPTYQQTTRYTYPSVGRVEIVEPSGLRRAIASDGRDQTIQEQSTDPGANTWRDVQIVEYDDLGRKASHIHYDYLDGDVKVAERCDTDYDAWGEACSQSFSDGRTEFNCFDPSTRIREEWTGTLVDKQRKRTTYRDDDAVESIEWLDEVGETRCSTTFFYGPGGSVTTAFLGNAGGPRLIDYEHDSRGRVVSETHRYADNDESRHIYRYTYPTSLLADDPIKIELFHLDTVHVLGERTFDAWGRVTSLTRAGITETYTYAGTSTTPVSKTSADGSTLSYRYIKELGHRIATVTGDDVGQLKSFSYLHGEKRRSTADEGETMLAFDHDLHDRVTRTTTHSRNRVVRIDERRYSPSGRLLRETDATGRITTYDYDVKGRRIRTTCGPIVTSHMYDDQGKLSGETVSLGKECIAVSYVHDALGREVQRRFRQVSGFDLTIQRRYGEDSRLAGVELKEGTASKGMRSYTYTANGQLKSCTTTGEWRPRNAKGKLIDEQIFCYDHHGHVTTRVTRFDDEECTSTYRYDENGSGRLNTVEHDHSDYKPCSSLTYDANGRVTRDASGTTYDYDWLGRLARAGSRYYTYDAMDRIATTGRGEHEHHLVYDGMQSRGEFRTDNDERYLEPGSTACTVQRVKRSGVVRTLFELRDADGTVLVTYDATAKTIRHHAYTAYGEHGSEETDSLLGFNGEYRDSDNDQYPLGQGYRSYDPASMRFQTADSWSPFGDGGPHAYRYGAGDPVNVSDPSGHWGSIGSGRVNKSLRRIWGSSLPGPLSMGKSGGLISTIVWSGLGILTAIATGGTSLILAAALVGMAIVAAATAIAAVIVADTNPELAAILGWVSLGFTIAGGVGALMKKAGEFVMKLGRTGMTGARNAYHKIAVAASRVRAQGWRSLSRSRRSIYRPGSGMDARDAILSEETLSVPQTRSRTAFSVIEEGYPVPFDVQPLPSSQLSALHGLMTRLRDTFDIGDVNTMVCTVTGVLGNAGYFESEQDAFINGNLNNATWLPWGSFNLGRYGTH